MLTQHLTAAALFVIMAALSTADFANAINDRSSLRGRSSAIANGSIDMWGEEPVTNGNSFNRHHQQQRNLQKREKQTTGQVSKVDIDRVRSSVNFFVLTPFPYDYAHALPQLKLMEMEEFVEEEKEKEKEVEESLVLVDQLKEDLEEVEWEGGDESLVVEQLVEKVEEVEEEEEEIIEQQWWWTVAGVALLPWCSWFNC